MTSQFSIIIPTYNRADGRLQRALDSVVVQTHRDFECIVVDDCSKDDTRDMVLEYMKEDATRECPADHLIARMSEDEIEHIEPTDPNVAEHLRGGRFHYVRHAERGQRVVAWNSGNAESRGKWLGRLDSDDALDQMYLATFAYHIQENSDARLWVCGSVYHGMVVQYEGKKKIHVVPKWTRIRSAWMPPVDGDGLHPLFSSGKIGTGMFVFHRECYEKIGPMPSSWRHPDHLADGIDEWLGLEFGTTGYGSGARAPVKRGLIGKGHIGNPWGDDAAMMLALTRHYRVYIIQAALYRHYVR